MLFSFARGLPIFRSKTNANRALDFYAALSTGRPTDCLKQSSKFAAPLLRVLAGNDFDTIRCYPRRFSVIGCRPARNRARRLPDGRTSGRTSGRTNRRTDEYCNADAKGFRNQDGSTGRPIRKGCLIRCDSAGVTVILFWRSRSEPIVRAASISGMLREIREYIPAIITFRSNCQEIAVSIRSF